MDKIKVTKRIIIHGDFYGRYQGDQINSLSSFDDYDIKIIDGKINNAEKTNYYDFISNETFSLRVSKIEDLNITLKDTENSKDYIFIEDLEDVLIYDIEFKDVIKEGVSTLGIIKGKVYGSIIYNEEVELVKKTPNLPKKNLEIIKSTANKIKIKTEENILPSFSILFYIFLFVCLTVFLKEKIFIFLLLGVAIYILRSILFYFIKILFRSASLIFTIFIFLGLWFVFSEGLNSSEVENDKITSEDPPEFNKLISRQFLWSDFDNKQYYGDFKFRYGDFINSRENKEKISFNSFNRLYNDLNNYDVDRMELIFKSLQMIKNDNNLNQNRFAEVVVSLIQSIPYSLNIPGECNEKDIPCISNVKYDILTPLEFFYYKKGDCDSRTLLIYTILKKFGYDVVILNSDLYGHSMIGINIAVYGKYKLINQKKYYFWETTNKGWNVGVLPPESNDISKWYLALK